MFVVGNETPFRQKEEVGLVLCNYTHYANV